LHIGVPKSGTTALQTAMSSRRRQLLRAGVNYPGTSLNHTMAFSAVMGRAGTTLYRTPRAGDWEAVVRSARVHPDARTVLSYELACVAEAQTASRIVADLGAGRCDVAITARPLAAMLPSIWQQYVKGGLRLDFETWATAVLRDPRRRKVTPSFEARHDLGRVASIWASIVGPERVHVIVLEQGRPSQLAEGFERLLSLPEGALRLEPGAGIASNRALTACEVELARRVQVRLARAGVGVAVRARVMADVAHGLQSRPAPEGDAGATPVPPWVSDAGVRLGEEAALALGGLGVDVIGDLAALAAPARVTSAAAPVDVSVDAVSRAVEAVAMLAARAQRKAAPGGVDSAAVDALSRDLADRGAPAWLSRPDSIAVVGAREGMAAWGGNGTEVGGGRVGLDDGSAIVAGVVSRAAGAGSAFAAPVPAGWRPARGLRGAAVRAIAANPRDAAREAWALATRR
jgi:hypothetical protein